MKFQDSWTNKETRESKVLVAHRKHIYPGYAKCHPDDPWSEYTGCRYAEMRAQIAALKAEHKEKKAACEEYRKFVKAVMQYKNFDKNDPSARAMFRQLNRRIREVNKLAEQIGLIEFNLKVAIRDQASINRKIKNDKSINN